MFHDELTTETTGLHRPDIIGASHQQNQIQPRWNGEFLEHHRGVHVNIP